MIISHEHPDYKAQFLKWGENRFNGAYYYSREITRNIIPNVETDRGWVTINIPGKAEDRAIVFIHNNMYPNAYAWLRKFRDLILVCGVPSTCQKVEYISRAIYLPLSVDVAELMTYRREKTKKRAFAGRASKRFGYDFPEDTEFLEGLPRKFFLQELATYEEVYAVGRVALEAKALGCKVLPYDPRYPDPDVWEVIDNRYAAKILQQKLDEIDG